VIGSDAGGEAEHDEAVAADGEQLLCQPELVAAAAVDAALWHHGRERPGLHAPQHRLRPAQRRRPQRRHLHLAARPRRPCLRLRPRRERALPGTRAAARPDHAWSLAIAVVASSFNAHALNLNGCVAIAVAAVGCPVARQSGSGGVAHPQRLQPRQLHLPAKSEQPINQSIVSCSSAIH
jgi:hypothetical protein